MVMEKFLNTCSPVLRLMIINFRKTEFYVDSCLVRMKHSSWYSTYIVEWLSAKLTTHCQVVSVPDLAMGCNPNGEYYHIKIM